MSDDPLGPYQFTLTGSDQQPQVLVRLLLSGGLMWEGTLTESAPNQVVDAALDEDTYVLGIIAAQFAATGEHGSLEAENLNLRTATFENTYTGTLGTW